MNKTKICVFAGTTEGRELIEFLSGQEQVSITACVATGYGKELLSPAENLTISSRRLDEGEMDNGMDFAAVTVTLSYTLSRQDFMQMQQLPDMGALHIKQEVTTHG